MFVIADMLKSISTVIRKSNSGLLNDVKVHVLGKGRVELIVVALANKITNSSNLA